MNILNREDDYYINERRHDCLDSDRDIPSLAFKVKEVKPLTYYVVELKFNKRNVKHRCIMATGFEGDDGHAKDVELYNHNYEDKIERRIKDIYWFRIIKEIPEMNTSS